MSEDPRDVVIGAGPAGLAAAAVLQGRGRRPVVLERAERVGQSWRDRYDCLRLNTTRWWSGLPGFPIPKEYGTWVTASDYASYLKLYAEHHRLDIRFATSVGSVAPREHGWLVETSTGGLDADNVVVATGYDREPYVPGWPGREDFPGLLIHASRYKNARPFRGLSVLVVGGGNSAADIAVDLVRGGAVKVWLAIRTPPQIVPRTVGGVPMQTVAVAARPLPAWIGDGVVRIVQRLAHGDLSTYGLSRPAESVSQQFNRADVVPVIDVELVRKVKGRAIEVVRAVHRFDRGEVLTSDGARLSPDAVIAATGYRRGLDDLVGGLGVLDEHGRPFAGSLPGLYFVGYLNPLSGNLRELGIEARRAAGEIVARTAPRRQRPAAAYGVSPRRSAR